MMNGLKSSVKIVSVMLVCGLAGCVDYYGPADTGGYYSYGPVYNGYPRYGMYGIPGHTYSGYPYGIGALVVDINDRPYYTRGPGYYVGPSYYVWKPGHWATRRGQRVWIHGHYVLRG